MDAAQMRARLEQYADEHTQQDTTAWLDNLAEDKFREEVTNDLGSNRDLLVSQGLRDPQNVARWEATLTALIVETQGRIAAVAGDRRPETNHWRRRANVFLSRVVSARQEARGLRRRYEAERQRSREPVATDTKQLRNEVGDIALRRLAEAHPEPFDRLLVEEYRKAGLKPPLALLDRLAGYDQAHRKVGAE